MEAEVNYEEDFKDSVPIPETREGLLKVKTGEFMSFDK